MTKTAPKKRVTKKKATVKKSPAKATTKKAPAKKAGRPAGAKTQERPEVTLLATPCHHCGSCNGVKNKRLIREGQTNGTFQGKRYTGYRHYNANCSDCNGAVLAKEFDFVLTC